MSIVSLEQRIMSANEVVMPLDAHIAEGIVVNGLFCGVQEQLVTDRANAAFERLRTLEQKKMQKETGLVVAYTLGAISLDKEVEIDQALYLVGSEQNHGMKTIHTRQCEIGDVIWSGYDYNSARIFNIFKRTAQTVMTNGEMPTSTMWGVKAVPGRL